MEVDPVHSRSALIEPSMLATLKAHHPSHNFMPRILGNAVCAPASSTVHYLPDGASPASKLPAADATPCIASFNSVFGHGTEVNQSWALLSDIDHTGDAAGDDSVLAKTVDLARLDLWRPTYASGDVAVGAKAVLAACPIALGDVAISSFLRFGRALSWKEEFDTFSPPDKWQEALRPERASVPLPRGLEVGTLCPDDASVVNRHWKYGGEPGGPVEAKLREGISSLPNACLRLASPMLSNDEQLVTEGGLTAEQVAEARANMGLVSWVLYRSDGSCGVMHTLSSFRGRSLAEHCVRGLVSEGIPKWKREQAQLAREAGNDAELRALEQMSPYCHINPENKASVAVFTRRLGFTAVNRVVWMIFNKMAPRFHLRPIDPSSGRQWAGLLSLINDSYGQDDAFWVDLIRVASEGYLKEELGRQGVFHLGYEEQHARQVVPGADPKDAVGFDGDGYLPRAACTEPLASCYDERTVHASAADAVDEDADAAAGKKLACAFYLQPPRELKVETSGGQQTFSRCCSLRFATVSPSLKKCGVAQRLLDSAVMTAKRAYGADAIDIHVVSVKPWLKRFYEGNPESGLRGNGFTVVGREELPSVMTEHLIEPYRSLPPADKPFFHHMVKRL